MVHVYVPLSSWNLNRDVFYADNAHYGHTMVLEYLHV
jgi:hypothetical protein